MTRLRKVVLIAAAVLTSLTVLEAGGRGRGAKAWSEPFDQWSKNQVLQLLKDSPWVKSQNIAYVPPGLTQANQQGQNDLFYAFTARFFSALPVREAYVRQYEILNHYDSMSAADKQQFNAKFKRALGMDVSNRVIVALEFSTNDPQASRNVMNFLRTATKDTFKQSAYLISQRLGRVDLAEYYPPSPDGTGAKFIFPRNFNGQPVVTPQDQNVRVDIYVPPVNQRIFLTFDVDEMSYGGNLSF